MWGRTGAVPRRFRFPQELRTSGAVVAFVGFWEVVLGFFLLIRCDRVANGVCVAPGSAPGVTLLWVGGTVLAAGLVAYLVGRLPAKA